MKRLARSISPPDLLPPEKLHKYVNGISQSLHGSTSIDSPLPAPKDSQPKQDHNSGGNDHHHRHKQDGTQLKIMSWNCDGLTKYLSTLPTAMDNFVTANAAKGAAAESTAPGKSFLSRLLARHNPDIMCLQEVHLWDTELKVMRKRLALDAPDYLCHACLPLGKAGRRKAGVLTLYKRHIESLASSTVPWDNEGRISVTTLPKLKIYNVYCLNSNENPYKDPVTGHVAGTRSERKRAFDAQLAADMQDDVKSGTEVLLLGDLNISRYKIDALGGHLRTTHPHQLNRDHFNQVFTPFRDFIREKYGQTQKYTWFSRAQDSWTGNNDKARVDLILGSAGIEVLDTDTLEDLADRGQSDHGPLYITILLPDS